MKISYTQFCGRAQLLLSAFFLFITASQAQVGIGNTNPDPSSALDIKSTTQGLLVPRMTTLERTAITTPANSLLVYDTDLESFFHFDATPSPGSWNQLASANKRDNYKLIKSAADLAPELAAGGGSRYLLNENAYYEINGTIMLTAPIELNNATMEGKDSNDILYSEGTVFTGNTGGVVYELTITGGGTVFDITGGNSWLLRSITIAGMGSVGKIEGVGFFFSNNMLYTGNTTGITYSNIPTLLLNNQGWMEDNGGTYETFTGTFSQIQKASGFSTINSGAVGIDVSSNPIVTEGVISATVFSGSGTFVKKYTVGSYTDFNFTNNWFVDAPGIPREADAEATGYYYMVGNTTSTNIPSSNTPYKIAGSTTPSNLFRVTHANNRLDYKGRKSRNFEITCTGTIENTWLTRTYTFYIYKNGIKQPAISAERKFSGNDIGNFTLIGSLNLAKDDRIEVYVESDASFGSVLITRLSLILK